MTSGTQPDSFRATVAHMLQVIEQHRDDGEAERRLPDATVLAMKKAELFSLWAAHEFGGRELDLPRFMEIVEQFSRADGASGWTFANLATGAVLIAHLPPEGAREIYAHGSNLALPGSVIPRGRAVSVDGGYRLSGQWPLASGCHHGDWLSGAALVFDGDTPRMAPDGAPDLQVMFFPREQVEILDTWSSLGLRGTGSTDFVVKEIFVPQSRVFPLFTQPPQVAGELYRLGILPLYSMSLTSVLLGIARAAIDEFIKIAKAKTPTLSQSGLASRATIHAEVARAEACLQSARAYLYEVARELVASVQDGGSVPDELEARRRLACANAGASCSRVVDAMFALAGTTPIYVGSRLERCLRDVHTASQHLVVSPVWWEKTGQYYLGLGLGMP